MITLINCAIYWAKAAVAAAWEGAEMHGAEPEKEDIERIANLFLNHAAMNHRLALKHLIRIPQGIFAATSLKDSNCCMEEEFHDEFELENLRQAASDGNMNWSEVVYYR